MDKLIKDIGTSSGDPEEVLGLVEGYVNGLINAKNAHGNTDIPNITGTGSAIPVLYPTRLQ